MRRTTALLTAFFLALPAAAGDDPNPEPPKPAPVEARLVASKKTYKLDLGGMTAAKFREAVKAGGVKLPTAATVDMNLVIINNTKSHIRVRTAGALPRLALTMTGPNVVEGRAPTAPAQRLTYTVLKPGEKVKIPITSLSSRPMSTRYTRLYWTEPGEYKLSASFYTAVEMDYNPNVKGGGRLQYTTLKTGTTTVKVEK